MHTFMQARKKNRKDHDRADKTKVHRGRTGKDGGAVGDIGHNRAELHTGKAQAAVDDGHENAGDRTGTRNLEGHALVIGNTQLVDGLGDDDAEGERREQVHGLIASQKALHGSACIVGSLRRGSRSQRRDHGGTHDQHDERNERGTRNAPEHARDNARTQRERKRDDKEANGKHQASHAERDALGQQRNQHLEGRGARARNSQARADGQIHRRNKELAKLRMHAPSQIAGRAGERDGDKSHNRQTDSGNQKADHGKRRGGTGLKCQQRRNDEVTGAKEHREQRNADGNDMVGAQAARSG